MKRSNLLSGLFAGVGMLLLILDSKTALAGAKAGIDLCIRTVIPSLYPFFLLSIFLNSALSGSRLSLLRPVAALCGVPEGAEAILISGFLGGYPVGAQAAASAYEHGQLSKQEADRLLSFCSNAGPAFLFGMVGPMFSGLAAPFLLWSIHIASALLVSRRVPAAPAKRREPVSGSSMGLSQGIHAAASAMVSVCSWVVMFRILLCILERWIFWFLPDLMQVILTGILELSNGCLALSSISDPSLRFLVCSGMLAWGGICVAMQTFSVARGLSFQQYLAGKLLQTLFSLLISAAIVYRSRLAIGVLLCFFLGIALKRKKEVEIPRSLVYNKGT